MCSISFCNRSGSFFHEPSLNSMSPFGRNISKIFFFGKLYSQLRFTEWGGVCLATFWHSMHFAGISAATRQERREAGNTTMTERRHFTKRWSAYGIGVIIIIYTQKSAGKYFRTYKRIDSQKYEQGKKKAG